MPARGKAQHAGSRRVDRIALGVGADPAHRALRVLERHIRPVRPALVRQAIAEHEDGDAGGVEARRYIDALVGDRHEQIGAAGTDEQRPPVGLARTKDMDRRDRRRAQKGRRPVRRWRFGMKVLGAGRWAGPDRMNLVSRPAGHDGHAGVVEAVAELPLATADHPSPAAKALRVNFIVHSPLREPSFGAGVGHPRPKSGYRHGRKSLNGRALRALMSS